MRKGHEWLERPFGPTRHFGRVIEVRSEEHTSELQSLMRNSYAVFCLKKKNHKQYSPNHMITPQPQSKMPQHNTHRSTSHKTYHTYDSTRIHARCKPIR